HLPQLQRQHLQPEADSGQPAVPSYSNTYTKTLLEGTALSFSPDIYIPVVLALFQEPVATFQKTGLLGVALAMFIGNFVQNNLIKNELKDLKTAVAGVAQGHQADQINTALLQLIQSTQKITE